MGSLLDWWDVFMWEAGRAIKRMIDPLRAAWLVHVRGYWLVPKGGRSGDRPGELTRYCYRKYAQYGDYVVHAHWKYFMVSHAVCGYWAWIADSLADAEACAAELATVEPRFQLADNSDPAWEETKYRLVRIVRRWKEREARQMEVPHV